MTDINLMLINLIASADFDADAFADTARGVECTYRNCDKCPFQTGTGYYTGCCKIDVVNTLTAINKKYNKGV